MWALPLLCRLVPRQVVAEPTFSRVALLTLRPSDSLEALPFTPAFVTRWLRALPSLLPCTELRHAC